MARRLPPLNALRAFEAAARHNSFTGAAEELRVSHAAISRHVRGLEARLGVTLFRRAPRGVALTEAGADYLAGVSGAFDAIAAATADLSSPSTRTLRASVEPVFAAKWLAPRIGDFCRRHPDIGLAVVATSIVVDLARDEADLAIRHGHGNWPGVRLDLLAAGRLVPVLSPRLVTRATPLRAPADLARLTLLHEDDGERWRQWFDAAGAPGVDGSPGPRLGDVAIDAALAGQGVALADDFMIAPYVRERRLVQPFAAAVLGGAYYLVTRDAGRRNRDVTAFRDWLVAAFKETDEEA